MTDPSNILNYYGAVRAAFLHPKGKKATRLLLEKLACKPNDTVLELGFGTGATLVYTASIHPSATFHGIEYNPLMFEKAGARIRFCGLKNIRLHLNKDREIPFGNDFFDAIYIESVLAIQEGGHLDLLISELNRILRPNGKLVINEGIWADSFSMEEISAMNAYCKSRFGIIQATEKYPYIADWKGFLESSNFRVEEIENLSTIKNTGKVKEPFAAHFLSGLFSLNGWVLSKFNPAIRKKQAIYKKETKLLTAKGRYLEGYLITARKLSQ